MSFIDTYMKKNRIGDITSGARKKLDKLEEKLNTITKKARKGLSFLDTVKEYGDEIGDLIERVQQHFDGRELTLKGAFPGFGFVYSIAIEVYQIIDAMKDNIVPDGLTGEAAWDAKRNFGVQLIHFIWKTVGPLDKRFNWIPFKKTIEKKIVFWLAGMGMDAARNMFKANKETSNFAVNNKAVSMKAL